MACASHIANLTPALPFTPFGSGKAMRFGYWLRILPAALLGHRVSLRSTEGAGTSVTISVPRASSSVQPVPRAHSVSLRGTVLLVEDDEIVAASTATLLEERGLKVEICDTTEAKAPGLAPSLEGNCLGAQRTLISTRRLRGSGLSSRVGISGSRSPRAATSIASAGTPAAMSRAAITLARCRDSRSL